MFLSIIPFIKKKVYFFHTSVYFHSHETMWLKIAYQLIESIKWIKQHLKNIYIYLFDYHIFNWSILSYFPPIFKRYKRRGREWKKSAIINMHRHEDKHLPALKNIPVATRHAQTPASKSRMHARPYICT